MFARNVENPRRRLFPHQNHSRRAFNFFNESTRYEYIFYGSSLLYLLSKSKLISEVLKFLDCETLGNFNTLRFFTAVSIGDFNTLVECLQGGVNVNSIDPEGWTALMLGGHCGIKV